MLTRRAVGDRVFYHGEHMITSVKPENTPEEEGCWRWTYNEVQPNSSHRGWIAGKPFGAFLHFLSKKSEPCRARMTGHALACPHCETKVKVQWRGYVPYYDEEYTRRFVLIAPEYLEAVAELEHLAPVVITRGKSKIDPVIIRGKVWRVTQPTIPHSAERADPVNLALFCVRVLWRDDILAAWDAAERRKAATTKPATPKHTKKPDMYTAAHRLADQLHKESTADEPLNQTYQRLLKKVAPSTNGDHTKTDDKAD